MKKILSVVSIVGSFLLPVVVFAAAGDYGTFAPITSFGGNIVIFINNTLVPLIFALAFVVFLWGIFKAFIFGGGDETKREEGKQLMLYSIIGFLVMVSLWGIVNLVSNGFGLQGQTIQNLPRAPGPNGSTGATQQYGPI